MNQWRIAAVFVSGMIACSCRPVQMNVIYQGESSESEIVAGSDADYGPGYEVLVQFSEAVGRYDYFTGSSDMESHEYMLQQVQEILLPHKEVLHAQALWRLNHIPVSTRMNTDGWVSAMDVPADFDIKEFYSFFLDMAPDELSGAVKYFYTWDVVQMFEFIRRQLLMRAYPIQIAGTVASIDAMMVPPLVRLNEDGAAPVLAIQREREFFEISFQFDEQQQTYVPQKMIWLVPKEVAEHFRSNETSEKDADDSTSTAAATDLPFRLSLEADAAYLAAPQPRADARRYKRWKQKMRIRVGQTHLSTAQFSSDESHLLLMSDAEATIRVYEVASKKLVGNYAVPGFSPDEFSRGDVSFWPSTAHGLRFVVGNDTGLAVYSALDGTLLQQVNRSPVDQMRFSEDGNYLLCRKANIQTQTTVLQVYTIVPKQAQLALTATVESAERIEDLVLSRDNQWLAVTYYPSNTVAFYNVQAGHELWTVNAPQYTNSLDISPDGRLVAVGGSYLKLIDAQSPSHQATYRNYNNNIHQVRFSPSGEAVASSSYDGHVRIVSTDMGTGELKLLADLRHGGTANVYSIDFRQDGSGLLSCSGDKTAIVWGK